MSGSCSGAVMIGTAGQNSQGLYSSSHQLIPWGNPMGLEAQIFRARLRAMMSLGILGHWVFHFLLLPVKAVSEGLPLCHRQCSVA